MRRRVQEAFLSAYRSLHQFRGAANPHTWLYRITVNAALQRVRERRPENFLDPDADVVRPTADWTAASQDPALTAELRERVEEALSRLPPDHRTAVILRDIEGLSALEAAQVLEIGELTALVRRPTIAAASCCDNCSTSISRLSPRRSAVDALMEG